MQNPSAKEHLDMCMEDMKRASVLTFADGVYDEIYKHALKKFEKHESEWNDDVEKKVRRSATFVGRFAETFALFDNKTEVEYQHAKDAINVVKEKCTAAFGIRLQWCPDLP